MDMRSFLTEAEIEDIKRRVVDRITIEQFADIETVSDGGDSWRTLNLKGEIDSVIESKVKDLLEAYIQKVADETIRPRIQEAANKMADRLVQQVGEITNKINWYFSIK